MNNASFISTDDLPRIEPPPTPLIKKEEEIQYRNIINMKLRRNRNSTASETYGLKMGDFESGSLDAILQLLANFDKTVSRTGTSFPVRKIAILRTLLRGEILRKYKLIIATYGGATENHLPEIRRGILKYFFLINTTTKKYIYTRRMLRKPRGLKLGQYTSRIQELNNLLPQFPGS